MTHACLSERIPLIRPIDPVWEARARARLDDLTKPPGSLGVLENIATRVATIQKTDRPVLERTRVIVMAGDHGVVAQGVAAYPQEVTAQMVANFASGGAAVNQLAGWSGAEVVVCDVGVAADVDSIPGVIKEKVARGTADMTQGPAMTEDQALRALSVGMRLADEAVEQGVAAVAVGEMGIGNTTAAAALTAAFTGAEPSDVVGPGTGLDDDGVARKATVVTRALEVNPPDADDALGVLAALGGLEIAGLAGVVIAAAAHGVPVVADGFISGAAALAAVRVAPTAKDYLFASHRSTEPGHAAVLDALGLEPVLDLGMRLGEGTGALLALGIMDAACRILADMATFAEAGVSDRG